MGQVSPHTLRLALLGLVGCALLGLWMGFDDSQPRADSVRQRLYDQGVAPTAAEPTAAVGISDAEVARAAQETSEEAPAASDAAAPASARTPAPAADDDEAAPVAPTPRPKRPAAAAPPPRPEPAPTPSPAADPVGELLQPQAPPQDPPPF